MKESILCCRNISVISNNNATILIHTRVFTASSSLTLYNKSASDNNFGSNKQYVFIRCIYSVHEYENEVSHVR